MNVLMLSNDLVFPSRVASLGREQGHSVSIASTPAALLAEADRLDDLLLLILDLATPGCDSGDVIDQLKQRQLSPKVVAFAPHVKTNLLEAARKAGCDQVLTRGQFDRELNDLLNIEPR